ncbi:hypothetical protein, partial [Pseudomonas sp. S30]|uniref:hypothetical protein n=1 Tax=Pseudomonas sp. S30 TaxID=2767445 RepID=UPI003FA3DBAE
STHTNCLIRFVKERLAGSVSSQPRPRILQQPYFVSSVYFEVPFEALSFESLQPQRLSLASLRASLRGGE